MKKIIAIILILIIPSTTFSNGIKTEDDFIPKPVQEKEIVDLFNKIPKNHGIIASSIITFLGLSLTVGSSYVTIEELSKDPGSLEAQNGLVLTTILLISTAITSLILKYFILRE